MQFKFSESASLYSNGILIDDKSGHVSWRLFTFGKLETESIWR